MTPVEKGLGYLQVVLGAKNPVNEIGKAQFDRSSALFNDKWVELDDSVSYTASLPTKQGPADTDDKGSGPPVAAIVIVGGIGLFALGALLRFRIK